MAIYEIGSDRLRKIDETRFVEVGLRERTDLQRLLRGQIEIVSPDTLVISEEFSQWEDSNRRIDLLGIDKEGNLVVIELKRTEDGGHMELQALRYAAMVSTMTFERAVEVYSDYLRQTGSSQDAQSTLLEFLELDEPDDDLFAQDVRIVLVSAEFSKELTTTVMWLNERGLDIQCIRLKPYKDADRVLVDVQQIIPLPEAEDYRVRLKEKQQRERTARASRSRVDKFDITIDGELHPRLTKRYAIYTVIRHLISKGKKPEMLAASVPARQNAMFRSATGTLNSEQLIAALGAEASAGGKTFDFRRFYCDDAELFHVDGKTYVFTNQWGHLTQDAIEQILAAHSDGSVSCTVAGP